MRRDGGVCWICGGLGADSADHVVPKSKGGTDHPSNLRAAHHNVEPRCNRYRSDRRSAEETRRHLVALGLVDEVDDLTW